MKILTPEELLGEKCEKHMWHHGTCDSCRKRLVFVCHFNYDRQADPAMVEKRDFGYRVCERCLAEAIFRVKGKEERNKEENND